MADFVQPGPRDREDILELLDRDDIVEAVDRLEAAMGMKVG
ncbi:MAG: hypothetical protein JWQ24_4901 [Tardiphaga sp.]|nr:hypothetical protein [Tardiphaga sp.]